MSNIEWTDTTWNPVIGCTPVSAGCLNCYAATMARRLEAMGRPEYAPRRMAVDPIACRECDGAGAKTSACRVCGAGGIGRRVRIAEVRGGRAVFTGEVRTLPQRLGEPLHWRKPRRVFVNSMSDLFHEAVPFEFVDRVFAVMALCPQHTFQVLTKRPERMAEYFRSIELDRTRHDRMNDFANSISEPPDNDICINREWPHRNVWLGTSVENQAAADERIPHLLRCPATVRFLSVEPLLEAVDLTRVRMLKSNAPERGKPDVTIDCLRGWYGGSDESKSAIDWVIVGGESGAGARPCNVEWIRGIVRQCRGAGVACFVKQMGAVVVEDEQRWRDQGDLGSTRLLSHTKSKRAPDGTVAWSMEDRKGGDPAEWPKDLRVREWPNTQGASRE